jgi:hypothetical protein
MAGNPAADRQALVEVINQGLLWHCLCAITRLEVPEHLAARPLPVAQLAAAVGADPDALWRVRRLVADHRIVTVEGDRVSLTDRGRLLCRDHPSSLWLSLTCVPVLDWPASGTIADIAGGTGTLLAAVLQATPGARGILVEQPPALEHAQPLLEHQRVADRCVLAPGDLFAPPPPADLYLLASVLHDWDDAHAARILAALGHSATTDTRLRIFEMLLPTDASPHRATMSDVLLLLLFDGAREGTLGHYRALLEDTGWRGSWPVPAR